METEKYLERINYHGAVEPTTEVLHALQKQHLLTVPFENLDIHYGVPIELNIARMFEKVINKRRGGFCYELNGLLYELLKATGFNVKMISARGFNNKEQTLYPEFDHLAIIATINSFEYLVDAGFGEFALEPLKIELNKIQNDKRGLFKIERYDNEYFKVSKLVEENWNIEYVFSMKDRQFDEFEEMCRYNQTSPQSHFTWNKLCSIATENGRITITNDKIKIKEGDTLIELPVNGEEEFLSGLEKYFNIRLNIEQGI